MVDGDGCRLEAGAPTADGGGQDARGPSNGTTRRELVWVVLWAAFVMLLTCIPYVYAMQRADGRSFSGFVWGVDEGNVYLTWMRQAAEGEVLFRNQYSTEPENPRFVNVFLQLGGRVSRLLHVDLRVMFHVLRLLGGVFLLVSFYLLVAELTRDRVARWAALALASVGSGCGWLIVLVWPQSGIHPVDVGQAWQTQPEAVTFLSLLLNGLFATSMALMCLTFLFALRAMRGDRRAVWWGGLCLLVLGNIHTYDVFAVWVALGVTAGIGIRDSGFGKRLATVAAIVAIGLPSVLWSLYATFTDPSFLAKGLTPTPAFRFVDYAVAYGLVGLLAVVGAVLTLRGQPLALEGSDIIRPAVPGSALLPKGEATTPLTAGRMVSGPSGRLPVVWALANALVLFIPVSFQRKMIEGLHLPLCILAGFAVSWLAQQITRGLRERGKTKHAMERIVLTVCVVVVLCIPSSALFVSQCLESVKTNNAALLQVLQPPIYLDPPDAQAMAWLRENATRNDVVLSSSLIGSTIPTVCPAKVWVGHWAETLHFRDRLRDANELLRAAPAPQALRDRGITMLYAGPLEGALNGSAGLDLGSGGLQCVYDEQGVRIYRVPPPGSR
ncbi:hypothetical protein LLH23_15150 [bacterium]|nr:hypothetical protein [bacterium]